MKILGLSFPGWKIRNVKYNVSEAAILAETEQFSDRCSVINTAMGNRKLNLSFEFRSETQEEFFEEYSNLNRQLKECTIQLNDMFYVCCLYGVTDPIRTQKEYYQLRYTFSILSRYKEEKEETISGTSGNVNNPGTTESPCKVSIIPSAYVDSLTLSGISDQPIVIHHLDPDEEVIIDGSAGTVLCGSENRFGDYDAWEFPRLLPGENQVTLSSNLCQVTITYKPLYL